ncbi:MAG: hypothetical protein R2849_16560 [Thermomicrobiales bacterium]
MFRPRGEHSIGLNELHRREVVRHDPDVGLVPPEGEWLLTDSVARGVGASNQPLASGFLIA